MEAAPEAARGAALKSIRILLGLHPAEDRPPRWRARGRERRRARRHLSPRRVLIDVTIITSITVTSAEAVAAASTNTAMGRRMSATKMSTRPSSWNRSASSQQPSNSSSSRGRCAGARVMADGTVGTANLKIRADRVIPAPCR